MLSVRRALFLLLCALALPVGAATWYVDTAAGINGDGAVATPWNSLSNILTTTIAPGDTVCVRGATTGAGWTVPEAGTNATTLLEIYDFNCPGWGSGSISATSGTAAVLANKGFVTIRGGNFQCSNCPAIQINASDVNILNNEIPGGDQGIVLTNQSTRSRVLISGNNVHDVQGNGSADASAAGIYMLQTTISTFSWTDLAITNNTLSSNLQGGINLKCDVGASACGFTRLTISGNTITDNNNTGIVLQDCYDGIDVTGSCSDITTYTTADFIDVVVSNNIVTGQTSGGGIAVYGLAASTNAQGKNLIANNISSNNIGVIGGIDLFNSRYVTVSGNTASNNTTSTIDGNGILIDYGNKNVIVRGNTVSNNIGITGVANSGVGIMILKGDDVDVYSNVGTKNRSGLFFAGASFVENNINVYNNTLLQSMDYGAYFDLSMDASKIILKNNILTGLDTCIYAQAGGNAQTENYNNLSCTTRSNFNGVAGWSNGVNSITTNPLLDSNYRPLPGSPLIGAGTVVGPYHDYRNCRLSEPPTIGAYERCAGDWAGTRSLSVSLTQAASRTPAGAR